MKKILSIILVLMIIVASFCSCSEEGVLFDSDRPIKIGVVQFESDAEYTLAREAFIEKLKEYDTDSRLVIDFKEANHDENALNTIINAFVADKKDIIVSLGSTATTVAKNKAKGEIPVFFMAVTNPIADKIMTNKSSPQTVTGVTDSVSPDSIINFIISDLKGGFNNLGIIYNTSEVEHIMAMNSFKDYMNTSSIPYVEAIISNGFEGHKAANDLVYYEDPSSLPFVSPIDGSLIHPNGEGVKVGVDAIYVSGDSVSKSAIKDVKAVLEEVGSDIVVYVADESMLISPDFATVKPVYREIGRQTAEMVNSYINGTPFDKLSCQDPLQYYPVRTENMEEENWVEMIENEFDRVTYGIGEEVAEPSSQE